VAANDDLISVIYHAAQGAETCGTYAEDAKRDGDEEAARYFGEVRDQNRRIAEKGKSVLQERL
jgi:plasmid stabilization system protein ParE